jgi:hypothetical protein
VWDAAKKIATSVLRDAVQRLHFQNAIRLHGTHVGTKRDFIFAYNKSTAWLCAGCYETENDNSVRCKPDVPSLARSGYKYRKYEYEQKFSSTYHVKFRFHWANLYRKRTKNVENTGKIILLFR